jgi:hypothetical protein
VSSPGENPGATRTGQVSIRDQLAAVVGLLLLVDFVVAAVMLATDKNLQTNFGAQSPYYSHWYGVLAMSVVDLLAGLAVLGYSSRMATQRMPMLAHRGVLLGALGWSVLAILAMVGIVTAYGQVGFPSQGEFAKYLFGVTAYPGALSYVPWLYDLLLTMYVLTAVVGIVAVVRTRMRRSSSGSRDAT